MSADILAMVWILASSAVLHAADTRYAPEWACIPPQRVIKHTAVDGGSLVKAVAALLPGDQLVIPAGTYSVDKFWDISVSGTAEAPVWIVAEEGAQVVLTRPDARQNVLNIGQCGPVHHLCLRGVEITGGSHGLRLGHCSEVWIDQCHIHHTGSVCLSANSADTRRLFLTRNHNHHGGGHGEGMYLGANNGEHITIINTGRAFSGGSWNEREGMLLANNVLYSRDENAINFPNGGAGVTITGNVILGAAPKQGTAPGRGLQDFVSVTWDGEKHDSTPAPDAPFNQADAKYLIETDFAGAHRSDAISGALHH